MKNEDWNLQPGVKLPGVKDYKGGKTSLGTSVVVLEEVRKQKALVADMGQLPPANSNENALLHRQCMLRHAKPKVKKELLFLFKSLNLEI